MKLTDLLPPDAWQKFEAELFDHFFLNCTVYNDSGIGITGKPNWCNALCPEIKSNPNSLATICAAGNQFFMAEARNTGKPVIDACDAGMLKIAVPVVVAGAFLGTAGGCGRLPEGGKVDTFIIQKTTGLDESAITALSGGLKPMTPSEALTVARYIEKRLGEIVTSYQET
ncbi:MAG: PocR ligand-binding domain-containing protein [Pseudomonadota bacterium]